MIRLVADDHMSHEFIAACARLQPNFPLIHLSDWQTGVYRMAEDPVILQALKLQNLIIVSCDRRTMAMHAAELTRTGNSHSGVILFRPSVSQMDYGKQSLLLVDFWREAANWDWTDRIEYLPR
jgi:hypothetical protein